MADATADPAAATANEASTQSITQEGVEVRFEIEPVHPSPTIAGLLEGQDVRVRFRILDAASSEPITGLYPAAWMDLLPPGTRSTDTDCHDKIESFLGGSLLSQAELDLNVYYVIVLNADATISIVDPLFGFGGSKLLEMVFLKETPADWAMTPDQERLFVTLPKAGQVGVVETANWELATVIDAGTNPQRIVMQGDGRYVWVGNDTADPEGGVSVLNARGLHRIRSIATGAGHHDIAFSADDRYAFVTNLDDGTVAVIDVHSLELVNVVPVGTSPVSVDYSPVADVVYVTCRDAGTIAVIDARSHELVTQIEAEPGIGRLRFTPDGRYALVLNTPGKVMHVIDVSRHRIVQTGDFHDEPDQIAFTDELAYIRSRNTGIVLMTPLDQLGGEGQPIPVIDFPGGQHPFGQASAAVYADAMVQAPGASAILVSNPGDEMIYYYKEGMAAPMGSFLNYGHEPLAVTVVDRSLQERRPGEYETVVRLRRPGDYDIAFFLDAPRVITCFPVHVQPNPDLPDHIRPPAVVALPAMTRTEARVGETLALRFRFEEPVTHTPRENLKDVQFLTFVSPGRWQKYHDARHVGKGIYEATFTPQHPGPYFIFPASRRADIKVNDNRPYILMVQPESAENSTGQRSDSE